MAVHQAHIYEHINSGGRSDYSYICHPGERFQVLSFPNVGLRRASSVSVSTLLRGNGDGSTALILFEQNFVITGGAGGGGMGFNSLPFRPYHGQFLQVVNDSNSETEINLTDYSYNDKTVYAILYAFDTSHRFLSLKSLFLNEWNTLLAQELPNEVDKVGNPLMVWDINPSSFPSSGLEYFTISQKLRIHTPFPLRDRDANFTYWIYVFINSDGFPEARVMYAQLKVQGGLFGTSEITDRVFQAIWNDSIRDRLSSAITFKMRDVLGLGNRFRDVYYLPGNQEFMSPAFIVPAIRGSSMDDTTICFEPM